MKKCLLLVAWIFSTSFLPAQQSFDDQFAFETDPAKKFSVYLPASYNQANPNKLMLAFHPFNAGTWNAKTWRDELKTFAENVGVILLCPDGGSDGRVDDPLDYRFTTALLDSAKHWFNIDEKGIFAMGFSVGGKATYEYGLEHASVFSGFIPIGAAINGTSELESLLSKALCKPFYLVHGENDSPGIRYEPIKAALEQHKAEVNFILMAGVGHTIAFPNRESVLKSAFEWIDTVTCKSSTGISPLQGKSPFMLYPGIVSSRGGRLYLGIHLKTPDVLTIQVWSMDGKLVHEEMDGFLDDEHPVPTEHLKSGMYLLTVQSLKRSFSQKFIVE